MFRQGDGSRGEVRLVLRRVWDSFFLRWAVVVVWMGLIFAFSSRSQLPRLPEPFFDVLLKKGGHFLGYGVLGVLLWRAFDWGRRRWVAAWVVAVMYAVSDEFHQSFVPGRHPSPWDVVIDACGAATLMVLVWVMWRFRGGYDG